MKNNPLIQDKLQEGDRVKFAPAWENTSDIGTVIETYRGVSLVRFGKGEIRVYDAQLVKV